MFGMGKLVLILILAFPVVEVLLLIKMGEAFGFWNTVAALILTGVAGSLLARFEGFRSLANIQKALERGEVPAEHALDALLIFAAGIFLVIPGFLSDVFALVLLVPFTRYIFKRALRLWFDRAIRRGRQSGGTFHFRTLIR